MRDSNDLEAIKEQLAEIGSKLDALLDCLEKDRAPTSPIALGFRWPRFSLRMLFVAVTALACWLGYEMSWIVQRRAMLRDPSVNATGSIPANPANVPWIVRMFGDAEFTFLTVPPEKFTRASRLFPEANVGAAVQPSGITPIVTAPPVPYGQPASDP